MKNKSKSFIRGAFILMFFGVLSKILGAFYRIPLTSIITPEGMGLYQMVFPVYSLMLTISSSGLPSSISKLVSEANAKKQYRQSSKIMRISFLLLFCFSLFCSVLVVLGAKGLAVVQGNKEAQVCYLGLAPAILFVGFISGFRGYFQGLQKMLPTAVSGFVEQLFKLVFGLMFVKLFLKKGVKYGVLGAMIGISLSELLALVFLLIYYVAFKHKKKVDALEDLTEMTNGQTAKQILSTSIFVTIGGLIAPLGMLVDSVLVMNILKRISFSTKEATTLFGLETGTVGSIVNMPVVLSLALSTAILPCVSAKNAKGDVDGARESASRALLFAFLIALPASFGTYSLALPIIKILYGRSLSLVEIETASQILQIASVSIFFLALVQVSAGILQGVSKARIPAISLSIGLVVKIILNVILIRIPMLNILGAEIANTMCYMVAFLINLAVIKKCNLLEITPKIFAMIAVSFVVFFAKPIYNFLIKANLNIVLSFLVCVAVIIAIYFGFVWILYRKELKNK